MATTRSSSARTTLSIKGETVQRIYDNHTRNAYIVNRRYQRKLVWSIEEKRSFIDSLRKGYPAPLILLGETSFEEAPCFEIIDGLQRLNAITSFIEGEFDLDGKYFDLQSIPETNLKFKAGELQQKTPLLSQVDCARVASYEVATSIYRFQKETEIDEVFRRINANGRHLSRQELRQAGATLLFPELVRKIATRLRGDVSAADRLPLSSMREISITNRDLPYGINVETLFWVSNKILTREYVRDSRDEEVIADVLAFMMLEPKPPSNATTLDALYGVAEEDSDMERSKEIESAVQKRGMPAVEREFVAAHDALRAAIETARKPFTQLITGGNTARAPRVYQVIFLAFHQLINVEKMRVAKPKKLAELLDGVGGSSLKISEGGNWSATDRQNNVNAVAGIIRPAFVRRKASDPATDSWTTEFENILQASKTENNLYDFKIGLTDIQTGKFNDALVEKIAKTSTAMANYGPKSNGYILIGVADDTASADQHEKRYETEPVRYKGFSIVGIDAEADALSLTVDKYLQRITQILQNQPMPAELRLQITQQLRAVSYFDKTVIVIQVTAGDSPVDFGGKFWVRRSSHNSELTGAEIVALTKRFLTPE
jgi:hypothetical protein